MRRGEGRVNTRDELRGQDAGGQEVEGPTGELRVLGF